MLQLPVISIASITGYLETATIKPSTRGIKRLGIGLLQRSVNVSELKSLPAFNVAAFALRRSNSCWCRIVGWFGFETVQHT